MVAHGVLRIEGQAEVPLCIDCREVLAGAG